MNITVTTEASLLLNISKTNYVQKTKEERVLCFKIGKYLFYFSKREKRKRLTRHLIAQKCMTAHAQNVTPLKPGAFEFPFLFK